MELFTPWHLILLVIVAAALYFGGKSVPEMSRSLGKSLRAFKSEMHATDDETTDGPAADRRPPALPAGAPEVARMPVPTTPVAHPVAAAPNAQPAPAAPGQVRAAASRPRPRPRPDVVREQRSDAQAG